jgi:c-di-GMP-binding flagellar brake protein YcgR
MNIPLQTFAQVVSILQRPTGNGDGMEKRRSSRMNVEAIVHVTVLASAKSPRTVRAITRDISQSGMGLVIGTGANAGDKLVIHLPRTPHPALLMLAVVKVCVEPADGVFKVGCEFVKELAPDELENLKTNGAEMERIQKSILSAV